MKSIKYKYGMLTCIILLLLFNLWLAIDELISDHDAHGFLKLLLPLCLLSQHITQSFLPEKLKKIGIGITVLLLIPMVYSLWTKF